MRSADRLTYSGGWLDRATARRGDVAWLEEQFRRPDACLVPLWRDRCLVGPGAARPVILPAAAAARVVSMCEPVFLGLDARAPIFAADLSHLDEAEAASLASAASAVDLRRLVGGLPPALAATLALARGLLHWHRHHRFCGACGAPTATRQGGHLRMCEDPGCARPHFPRIEPAVITLVEAPEPPDRCLLVRSRGAGPEDWSLVAGFVEVGESLEDAVRREVGEEAGVTLGEVAYLASQAWPFPAGLMVGFRARATEELLVADADELDAAGWFSREAVAALVAEASGRPRRGNIDSIERFLLDRWLADPAT